MSVECAWNTWDETTRQTNIWSGKVLGVMYKMYCFWLWYVICVSIKSNSSLLDRNDAIQCSFVLFLLCWQQSAVWSLDSVTDSLHDARMSYYDAVIAILTILVSLALVILLIGAAWWLMWKVGNWFMSFNWTKLQNILSVVSVKIPVYQRDPFSAKWRRKA